MAICKWRASVAIDIRAASHDFRIAAVHAHLDRVETANFRLRLAHLELVVTGERLLQTLDGDVREVKRLRVKAAGVGRHFSQADFERVIVGLREVERKDADARRLQRQTRRSVHRRLPNAVSSQSAEAPSEKNERLRSG